MLVENIHRPRDINPLPHLSLDTKMFSGSPERAGGKGAKPKARAQILSWVAANINTHPKGLEFPNRTASLDLVMSELQAYVRQAWARTLLSEI